ncbi:branched-chain amino acid transport system ATP-binding protein [Paenibacillus sp. PvR052]|nr:branched-chain amino acid transport system ATP-binding protein [Paenibacillus sp. PvP091]MBP1169266.1 branched-chain amino acid transport system ATP-binding protein [Paenibacillus sp. PvR098]MBP2440293.1 branched-chain amino acid transport system ATP-binding protein [Paenibacillus sp. PvP052]
MVMLSVQDLHAGYGQVEALRSVNMDVKKGEIVCLIGNNGAGKSTTLMSISGIVKKRSGQIMFNGENILGLPPHKIVAKGISQVPEGRRIFPTLTVEENLKAGAFLKPKLPKEKYEAVYELFPRLKERRKQLGGSMSGGEQQMLAIGRAIVNDPMLLMLDEPSLGLAPQIIESIFDAIVTLRKNGLTVLLIEQNANLALDVSDRAYVMELGQVVLSGSCQELKNNNKIQEIYLGRKSSNEKMGNAITT